MPIENPPASAADRLERQVQRLTAAVAVLGVGFALTVTWGLLPRPEVSASQFTLRDGAGTRRGALALREDGSPTVRLNNAAGRAILYGVVLPDGTPRFRLSDTTGQNRIVLEVTADGSAHARLLDPRGRTGVHAWLAPDGHPSLDVRWGAASRHVTLPDSTGGPESAHRAPRER
jgi:hypothetical protein